MRSALVGTAGYRTIKALRIPAFCAFCAFCAFRRSAHSGILAFCAFTIAIREMLTFIDEHRAEWISAVLLSQPMGFAAMSDISRSVIPAA